MTWPLQETWALQVGSSSSILPIVKVHNNLFLVYTKLNALSYGYKLSLFGGALSLYMVWCTFWRLGAHLEPQDWDHLEPQGHLEPPGITWNHRIGITRTTSPDVKNETFRVTLGDAGLGHGVGLGDKWGHES